MRSKVVTGKLPFYHIPQDFSVVLAVKYGKRPPKPSAELWLAHGLEDYLWDLIERCWRQEHEQRPTAKEVVEELRLLSNTVFRASNDSRYDWDVSFMGQFRSKLHNHPFCIPQHDKILPNVQEFIVDSSFKVVHGEFRYYLKFLTLTSIVLFQVRVNAILACYRCMNPRRMAWTT
jgi:hypothetical protein